MKDINRDEGVVRLDGLDEAIVGIAYQHSKTENVLCYDVDKIVTILMTRDEMTYEEAHEYFEFNIGCLWAGEGTPIFLSPASLEEIAEHLEFAPATE